MADTTNTAGRVQAVRDGMLGITLGDTEHVMKLNDARLLAREIENAAFAMSEGIALRHDLMRMRGWLNKIANTSKDGSVVLLATKALAGVEYVTDGN